MTSGPATRVEVYRGPTRAVAETAYHAAARTATESGYVPASEEWSTALGQHTLTVTYFYEPSQVAAVLSAIADAERAPTRSQEPLPPNGATPAAPSAPATPNTSGNQLATGAGVAWLAAAALTGYLALEQFGIAQQVGTAGLTDPGLGGYAVWNGIAALITAFFGVAILRGADSTGLAWSVAWAVLNVGWGVVQVANGSTSWAFYAILVAIALAGVLSFAARRTPR